jgi:pimeloyl-ACP methyl ester carboxylesterase
MSALAVWVAAAALAGPVKLTAADGVKLAGDEYGTGAKGVLLIHDEGRTRADWTAFAGKLAASGFHVVTLDLRGHGGSVPPSALAETDWPKLTADVDAGVALLKSKGATEIHVVAARTGGNVALASAAANPAVCDLVLLTPTLTPHGIKLSSSIGAYASRPLMVAVSADDPLAVKTADWLETQVTGPKRVDAFPAAGAGAVMLNKVPDLENLLTAWMNGAFREAVPVATGEDRLKASEVEDIETTGTRLEDRSR